MSRESRKEAFLAKQQRILARREQEKVARMAQLPKQIEAKGEPSFFEDLRNLPDTDSRASLLLTVGSLAWKGFEALEHADFLLSFKEENVSVIFQFFNNVGWLIVAAFGAIWFLVSIQNKKRADKPGVGWSLVATTAFVSLMFGLLLAVKVTGSIPALISQWGSDGTSSCYATIETARLASFSSDYKVALICGVTDPTLDALDDKRIMISNPFSITGGPISIVTSQVRQREQWNVLVGKPVSVWHMPVLIPIGLDVDKIATLSDVKSVGGKILNQAYW